VAEPLGCSMNQGGIGLKPNSIYHNEKVVHRKTFSATCQVHQRPSIAWSFNFIATNKSSTVCGQLNVYYN